MPWRADQVPGGDAARPTRWHGLPAGPCGCGSRPALPADPRWRGRYPAPASAARSPILASRPGGAGHHAFSEPCASLGGKAKVQLLVSSTITRPGWRSGRAVVACGSCRRPTHRGPGPHRSVRRPVHPWVSPIVAARIPVAWPRSARGGEPHRATCRLTARVRPGMKIGMKDPDPSDRLDTEAMLGHVIRGPPEVPYLRLRGRTTHSVVVPC